ncbi:MAG: hypothetical protein QOI59_5009 [Gammaproteobacteria bacterium]|jgi:uncharacterized membrane protein YoaK (UPF0700 family)|nr:hypothetical protein [Gammaproteobacteria bacterium]
MLENRPSLPLLLSLNAGYVDTAGFLALQGLFTAHVTGNFVTLGATLALGTSGALAKLLALPVFCAVVIAMRLLNTVLANRQWPALDVLIALKVLLLFIAAALAIRFGPFQDADSARAVLTGMLLVAAMAIQNALHRFHLGSSPPSTLMTGTTTQVMIDIADRIHAPKGTDSPSGARLAQLSTNILIFAIGCGAAALLYNRVGVKCLLVPPMVGTLQLILRRRPSTG